MQAFIEKRDLEKLARIVREQTGNHVQEKNYQMLESRILGRMAKLRLETIEQYWTFFRKNELSERLALQSLMTTHYTFFFREHVHFEVLEAWLNEKIEFLKKRYNETEMPLKIWSAGCSRGQEVYSLAAFCEVHLFKKHGVPYEILGTDIDHESVQFAQNGVYPIKEVSTIPLVYLSGNFKKGRGDIKKFAAVNERVKSRTRFSVHNLLESDYNTNPEKFDLIFCRNVFIYFTEEKVKKITRNLLERMKPDGLLFSGLSEPLRFAGWDYPNYGPSCYQIVDLEKYKSAAKIETKKRETTTETSILPPFKVNANLAKTYSVLCVDDSVTVQSILKKIFEHDLLCDKVDFASNGQEAAEMLEKNKYDLITLDIHMPVVNGIEFLEHHYDKKKHAPVLVVSSVNRSDLSLANKALSLGAFDYVEKPEMNTLRRCTDEILAKAKMALRYGQFGQQVDLKKFDASIGRKIVISDASQCLRVVVGSDAKMNEVEMLIRSQENEHRSPPLVLVWKQKTNDKMIHTEILNWTSKPVQILHDRKDFLKPNQIYIVKNEAALEILNSLSCKNLSLQVIDSAGFDFKKFNKAQTAQILLDESLVQTVSSFERENALRVHDVVPTTSFSSLSVEYFAQIRKLAA